MIFTVEVIIFIVIIGGAVAFALNRQLKKDTPVVKPEIESSAVRLREEMEQSADEIISRLDERADKLTQLIQDADRRLAELEWQRARMADNDYEREERPRFYDEDEEVEESEFSRMMEQSIREEDLASDLPIPIKAAQARQAYGVGTVTPRRNNGAQGAASFYNARAVKIYDETKRYSSAQNEPYEAEWEEYEDEEYYEEEDKRPDAGLVAAAVEAVKAAADRSGEKIHLAGTNLDERIELGVAGGEYEYDDAEYYEYEEEPEEEEQGYEMIEVDASVLSHYMKQKLADEGEALDDEYEYEYDDAELTVDPNTGEPILVRRVRQDEIPMTPGQAETGYIDYNTAVPVYARQAQQSRSDYEDYAQTYEGYDDTEYTAVREDDDLSSYEENEGENEYVAPDEPRVKPFTAPRVTKIDITHQNEAPVMNEPQGEPAQAESDYYVKDELSQGGQEALQGVNQAYDEHNIASEATGLAAATVTQAAPKTTQAVQPATKATAPAQAVPKTTQAAQPATRATAPAQAAPKTAQAVQPATKATAPAQAVPKTAQAAQPVQKATAPVQAVPKTAQAAQSVQKATAPVQATPKTAQAAHPATKATAPVQAAPKTTQTTQPVQKATAPAQAVPKTTQAAQTATKATAPAQAAPKTTQSTQPVQKATAPAQAVPKTTQLAQPATKATASAKAAPKPTQKVQEEATIAEENTDMLADASPAFDETALSEETELKQSMTIVPPKPQEDDFKMIKAEIAAEANGKSGEDISQKVSEMLASGIPPEKISRRLNLGRGAIELARQMQREK